MISEEKYTVIQIIESCYRLNVCVLHPPDSYVEILIPNVMLFGGRAFGM